MYDNIEENLESIMQGVENDFGTFRGPVPNDTPNPFEQPILADGGWLGMNHGGGDMPQIAQRDNYQPQQPQQTMQWPQSPQTSSYQGQGQGQGYMNQQNSGNRTANVSLQGTASFARGGNVPANKRPIAQGIASLGRGKDTMLVHMTPEEVQGLQKLAMAHGGSLTINPQTGLPEAGFLSSMLPMLIGAGLMMIPGMQPFAAAALTGAGYGAATGSLKKGLMAGIGAYGGAGLGAGLSAAAGTTALPAATTAATTEAATLTAAEEATKEAALKASAETLNPLNAQTLAGTPAPTLTPTPTPYAPSTGNYNPFDISANASANANPFANAPVNTSGNVGALNQFGVPASAQMPGTGSLAPLSPDVAGIEPPVSTPAPSPAPSPAPAPAPAPVYNPSQTLSPDQMKDFSKGYNPNPSLADKTLGGLKALGTESGRDAFLGNAATPAGTVKGVSVAAVPESGVGGLGGLAKYSLAAATPAMMEPKKLNAPGTTPTEYYNTSYSPGERNPRFGEAGQPYFINQGFTKGTTSRTANVAGGGLLAFNGTTGSYVPESSVSSRYNPYNDDPESEIIASRFKDSPKSPYAKQPSISASVKKLSAKQVAALADSPDEIGYSEAVAQDVLNRATDKYYKKGPKDYTAATGGSIRGYDEGGDVAKPAQAQPQQPYQSPFQIQQNRPDATALNQYMSGLNKSLQGAPAQKYSAPSFTSKGVIPGEGNKENGEPFPDVPAYTFNPSRPIAPVAPVAQPAIQPVTQPSPGLPSIGQPAPQPAPPPAPPPPPTQPASPGYFPGFDEFKSTYTPPPPPTPQGEITKRYNGEDTFYQDEAGQNFSRDGDDDNHYYTPINYGSPEQAYQKLIDERMANPPVQQPTYTPPTYTPPTQPTQPTSQPSDGGMVTDQWGNTYYEPAPPPPAPPIDTSNIGLPFGYQDDNGAYVGYDNNLHVMPSSPASDTGGIASLIPPDSAPMGGDLRGMVQPPIPQPQTPPPPPDDSSDATMYNGQAVQYGEDGRPYIRDEDGNVRPVRDEHYDGGDKAGGPIKAKKYAMGGIATLQTYAAGGKLLNGDGDGMSDSIPAVINGPRPQRAALADGEFVIPADVVSHLGNGSTKAGAKRLYQMMDKVRMARVGTKKQGKQINPSKFMPA